MIKKYKDFVEEGMESPLGEYPHQYQSMENPDDKGESGNLEFAEKNSNFQAIQNELKTIIYNNGIKNNPNLTEQDVENALIKFFELGDFKKEQIKKISDECKDVKKCAQEIYDKYIKYVKLEGSDKTNDVEQDSIMESNEWYDINDKLKILKSYIHILDNSGIDNKLIRNYFIILYNFLIIERMFSDDVIKHGKEINKNLKLDKLNNINDVIQKFNELYDRYSIIRNNVETFDNIDIIRKFLSGRTDVYNKLMGK